MMSRTSFLRVLVSGGGGAGVSGGVVESPAGGRLGVEVEVGIGIVMMGAEESE